MKYKFIPISEPSIGKKELKNVINCIKTGWISSSGNYIGEFETKFAKYCGTKYGIATSNGTAALHLALAALGIKAGDEVIVPNLTFIATANTVAYTGATPVFVDSESNTWNMNPRKIEEKITSRTKAIIPVHIYGQPCNIGEIVRIARKHNLYVIEDCAEAHGAEYYGKKVGSFSDISCFSFYGNKIITTGEGGMCLTNNKDLDEKMRILRDHGMSKTIRYWHPVVGFNYRMTNLQAAVGVAQLERIDELISKRKVNCALYNALLEGTKGITFQSDIMDFKKVCWMYSILIENSFPTDRDTLIEILKSTGIDSRPFFYPITAMTPYKSNEKFPIAEEISARGINLPSSANLKEEDIKRICEVIKNIK